MRDTKVLVEFGMLAGDPAVLKLTLWVSDAKSHDTLPPTAIVAFDGVNCELVVAAMVAELGLAAGAVTVTVATPLAVTPSLVSDVVMPTEPGEIPVTTPAALTMAVVGVAVVKVKPVLPAIAAPFASRAVGVSASVPPIDTVGVAAVTVSVANS